MKSHPRWLTLILILLTSPLTGIAHASVDPHPPKLKIHWACQLFFEESPQVDCNTFRNKFFDGAKNAVTETQSLDDADIQIQITFQELPQHIHRYYLRLTPSARFHSDTLLLPAEDVPALVEPQVTMSRLEKRLLAGIAAFASLDQATVGQAGDIRISTTPLSETEPGGIAPDKADQKIYFEAGANGNASTQGDFKNTFVTAAMSFDYFGRDNKFRLQVAPTYSYVRSTGLYSNGIYTGEVTNPQVTVKGIYSVAHRWSFAIITIQGSAHGTNIRNFSEYATGVEYVVVPFKKDQPHQFMFRAGPSFSRLILNTENDRGNVREQVIGGFVQIAYVNQIIKKKLILNSSAKTSINPGLGGSYSTYVANVVVSYNVTKSILLDGSSSFTYQKQSLTYPTQIDFTNPAQVAFIAGSGPAGLNYSYSFGVKFTIGAGSKKTSDQRWNN